MFHNLTLFRFPCSLDFANLAQFAEECRLKPVGPLELSSRGFVPPMGEHRQDYIATANDAIWITIGGEDRVLPAAVVNEALHKRMVELEHREGRRPGGRSRKRMRDELIAEMLPRAFVRPSRTDAIIDYDLGVIAVDTPTRKRAESVVSEVRAALGSFPALPVNAEVAPRAVMTGWIAGDPLPEGLALGAECELRDPADSGAVVKVRRMELQGEEIATNLDHGKQVARLALIFDDLAEFVIDESLTLRRFHLLDGAIDALESVDREDVAAELDARFALFAGIFAQLFPMLERAFQITKAEG